MEKNNRTKKITFRVSEAERHMIRQRMILSHTRNQEAYLRKMAMDGLIVNVDTTYLKKEFEEMHKIGVNINQIAKQINTTGQIYQRDIEEVQRMVKDIWHILRSSQSKLL